MKQEASDPITSPSTDPRFAMSEKKMSYEELDRLYQEAGDKMVDAGLRWLADHKDARPSFDQYKHFYGITANENDDMKQMQKAMFDAVGGDCTGAMMQATTNQVLLDYETSQQEESE